MDIKSIAWAAYRVHVRTFVDEDGEIWCVAKDVAAALGYSPKSAPSALLSFLPWGSQLKGVKPIDTLEGGVQDMICVSERGLYMWLGRCDKPRALGFQLWVSGVIREIRRTGSYSVKNKDALSADDVLAIGKKMKELEERAEMLEPKAALADEVIATEETYSVGHVGKIFGVGADKMFDLLSSWSWIYRRDGKWSSHVSAEKRGWVCTKTSRPWTDPRDGKRKTSPQVRVYPKAFEEIAARLNTTPPLVY